ncbi:protein kinase [Lujinxingia vulgaris]|uniref:non-specific serine/threonine protein kinase n=1 Tax=Lujinxingia vulgaris TaxID=2600176 RepID=A0A5C6XGC6_9DELT|nr:serine/threonine-protein kinase [Lujinxingia vulgaris]TXD38473.1 protein kinase [Lujinxingia vulgaris]
MQKICPTCQRSYGDEVVYCPHDGMKLRHSRPEGDDPMIGRVLDGRWIIEKAIGAGGMGAVYLGHQRSVDRQVAIKTLRANLSETDDFVDRFFREARIATTINHPHSVTILDFGQDEDGTLYLAMEYLVGTLLSERIEEGNITFEEILRIGVQIASALSAAHDANIVHRDLKPDNIFLLDIPGGGTFVKVLDFGIAKVLGAETQVTRTGQVFGTPQYMSPEQCQGHEVDGRADLYSLGCILYELVGGRPPFSAETPMAILMAHVVNEIPPLSQHCSAPAPLERAINSLLAKDPTDRPADASAARALFEALLAELDPQILASSPGPADPNAPAPSQPVRPGHTITETQTQPPVASLSTPIDDLDDLAPITYGRRSRTPLILGALAVVIIAGAAFAMMGPAGDAEESAEVATEAPSPADDGADVASQAEVEAELRAAREELAREQTEGHARELAGPVAARARQTAEALQAIAEAEQRAEARASRRPSRRAPAPKPRPEARTEPEPQPEPAPQPEAEPAEDDPFDGFFSE